MVKEQGRPAGIEHLIHIIRGKKVILDSDLARIYGVPTKRFNEQVKRNRARFPEDFLFQLTRDEALEVLRSRSQFATLKRGQNIKYLPYVFTEHGAVMAANVLNSRAAVQMSVFVVRAFVSLRAALVERKELFEVLSDLEKKLTERLNSHEIAIVSACHLNFPRSGNYLKQNARNLRWFRTFALAWETYVGTISPHLIIATHYK